MQKRVMAAVMVILFMFALIAIYMFVSYDRLKPDDGRICEGISVGGIDIGGMTAGEAEQAVNACAETKKSQKIEIDVNGKIVGATVGEIGYVVSAGNFMESAMSVGRTGNMLENVRAVKAAAQGKISYPVKTELNEDVLRKFIKQKCQRYCTKVKNAEVKREAGKFVYTKSRDGVTIDSDETCRMIREAVEASNGTDVIRITANVKVRKPKVTQETAARCKDRIGTFSTVYSVGNVNRSKNLENAARLINGSVLYPGKTFSVHDAISPLTEENGYYEAASYNNGKVEDSLGGGVCQISTTLYNAVLRAELEVTERSPHSMVVSYVKPSMDAAIAGDYKDFKFKNNTDVPIYIEGGTQSGTIYFHVYGEETRSQGREVTFESEVTETIEPGADKITFDKTKPESFTEVTQEAHTGCKAILWKIVRQDGKETKTQVNSSTYSASPRYVTKGAMKAPQATKEPKETKNPKATKEPKETERPKNTKKPAQGNKPDNGNAGNPDSGANNAGGDPGGNGTPDGQGVQPDPAAPAQDPAVTQ